MSHSQFHSIRVLILRHAWLNLLDKHMTTGRINQVTTLRKAKHSLSSRGNQSIHFTNLQNDFGVF